MILFHDAQRTSALSIRNARAELTRPMFEVSFDKRNVSSTEKNNWVKLNTRNVSDVVVTVTRTKLLGNHSISFVDKDDMAKLKASLLPATTFIIFFDISYLQVIF